MNIERLKTSHAFVVVRVSDRCDSIIAALRAAGVETVWDAGSPVQLDARMLKAYLDKDCTPIILGGSRSQSLEHGKLLQKVLKDKVGLSYRFDRKEEKGMVCIGTDTSPAQGMGAEDMHLGGLDACLAITEEALRHCDYIHLVIDLSCFAAPFAPGVDDPAVLGVLPWQVLPPLRFLAESGKVVIFEIAGFLPEKDRGHLTEKLAATLLSTFITATRKTNRI